MSKIPNKTYLERMANAKNPKTPKLILRKLLIDSHSDVAGAVWRHPKVTDEMRETALSTAIKHESREVRGNAPRLPEVPMQATWPSQ